MKLLYLEEKAGYIVLTDRRFAQNVRRYIRKKTPGIARDLKELWLQHSKAITTDTAKEALNIGTVPKEWKDAWTKEIREFIRDSMTPAWIKSITKSGDDVAVKVNQIKRKQYDFDTTLTAVKGWVDNRGGSLIVDLTAAQTNSIHALLQHQISFNVTSPYILAQRLKPLVGLTEKEAAAIAKFMASGIEEGLSADIINKQSANYAKFLHKNRAARIARTELSGAYNFGHLNSLQQAAAEGWLPGIPEKSWIAGGADPCEICLENEAAGYIGLNEAFPSGDQHPPAHPHDECSLGSRIKR